MIQTVFTRYSICRWSPQIRSLRGYTVHTNTVAAVQPNVAPDSMSLWCVPGCVLAWKYRLNDPKKSYCCACIVAVFRMIFELDSV